MIAHSDGPAGLRPEDLAPFFFGWRPAPTVEQRLNMLRGSAKVWLAFDGDRLIGFINAIMDGALMAFIPLLEVLPEYQGQGVGKAFVRRMTESLATHYSVDIVCDPEVAPFYAKLGFIELSGMASRNRDSLR